MRGLWAGSLFLVTSLVAVAADPLAGNWKFRFQEGDQPITFLLSFSQDDGKWVGDFIGSSPALKQEPKFGPVVVEGDTLRFSLAFNGKEFISFEGKLDQDTRRVRGSYNKFGGELELITLYPSKLKKLSDRVEMAREDIAQLEIGPEVYNLAFEIFSQAATKKVPAEEVRALVDRLTKNASSYGPRWERTLAIKVATTLGEQAGFSDIALTQARRAERMLSETASAAERREVYQALELVLTKANKADEAKKFAALLSKLDESDYADYLKAAVTFPLTEFKGRKALSDRVVVVEQLTCSEVASCGPAEAALLALSKTFKPTEVILLSYHVPARGMDALSCQDGLERLSLYANENKINLEVPKFLINGLSGPGVAGLDEKGPKKVDPAKLWYDAYRTAIEKELDKPSTVSLELTQVKSDKGLSAKATVRDLEKPSEKMTLRFVLLESRVRFSGGNTVPYHENVVRALPGGVKGFPLTKKTTEQMVLIDVAALQERQRDFLEEFTRRVQETPLAVRPTDFKNLKLVALVQDSSTGEILQATQLLLK